LLKSVLASLGRLLLREARVSLDFTNLKDVALFVCRDEQRPLISVTPLSAHETRAEIVLRRSDVVDELRMLRAVRLQTCLEIAKLSRRPLGRDRNLAPRPVDAVPEDVRVSVRREPFGRPSLDGPLQIVPVDGTDNDEVFDDFHDAPYVRGGTEVELFLGEVG